VFQEPILGNPLLKRRLIDKEVIDAVTLLRRSLPRRGTDGKQTTESANEFMHNGGLADA
jgi:hypothetical protein